MNSSVYKYLWLAGLAVLISCSGGTSVLATEIPQIAAYAEAYNALQSQYRIHVRFTSDASKLQLEDGTVPDLVAGRNLQAGGGRDYFQSLDYVFNRADQPQDRFYPGLLEMGRDGGSQVLLPLSFDPLVLLSTKRNWESLNMGLLADLDEVKKSGMDFNSPRINPTVIGLSLGWSDPLFEALLHQFSGDFSFGRDKKLSWNPQGLEKALAYLGESRKANGGEAEDKFEARYLPGFPVKLLKTGKILYHPVFLTEYLNLLPAQQEGLDYRYPALNSKILPGGRAVFLGLPRGSPSPRAAEDFATWLIRTETQKNLLEFSKAKKIPGFGVAEGLSSLISVNETLLPVNYPSLAGQVPRPDAMHFPPARPAEWNKLSSHVIIPWIKERLRDPGYQELESYAKKKLQDFD